MSGAGGRPLAKLLQAAADSRAAGDIETTRAAYARVFEAARAVGDVDAMTQAALGLAAGQSFGTFPGRVPAFLHQAYELASGPQRARVAVALARAWVYGGDPGRAVAFADEAVTAADRLGDPVLLGDALDAQLLVHWGPDELPERLRITRRLEDAVVHLTDVEARLSAHLWRLTTAVECLDLPGTQRQLRALEALADESGSARVHFFAAARRGMYSLLTGDLGAAARARDAAVVAGTEAGERDTRAIDRTLSAGIARQAGDLDGLAHEAALYDEFGTGEGVPSIAAEAAVLWVAAGHPDRAVALLHQLAGDDFYSIPRDVDWLLVVTSLTEVAVRTGQLDLTAAAVPLLIPFSGRGVVNAGAAAFLGVVDDFLFRATVALGRTAAADGYRAVAEAAYRRMGATWWLRRLTTPGHAPRPAELLHLHPADGGVWVIGPHADPVALPATKGLRYLRLLLGRPGQGIAAGDLSAAVAGHPGAGVRNHDLGPVLDGAALAAYRRRLAELDAELGNPARAARAEQERAALIAELARATGLGGRARRPGGTDERARIAVRKAIAAAIGRIRDVDPATARVLSDTVTTGGTCRYDPDPDRPVRWLLDPA